MAATRSIRHATVPVGLCALTCLLAVSSGQAQVTTAVTPDASLAAPSIVTQVGNQYDVTGGARPGDGANLFHSFSIFDIATGDTVSFLNDSGLLTDNIISRVTGGSASNICRAAPASPCCSAVSARSMRTLGSGVGAHTPLPVGEGVTTRLSRSQESELSESIQASSQFPLAEMVFGPVLLE